MRKPVKKPTVKIPTCLEAEVEVLRYALRPFADYWKALDYHNVLDEARVACGPDISPSLCGVEAWRFRVAHQAMEATKRPK